MLPHLSEPFAEKFFEHLCVARGVPARMVVKEGITLFNLRVDLGKAIGPRDQLFGRVEILIARDVRSAPPRLGVGLAWPELFRAPPDRRFPNATSDGYGEEGL